MKIWIKGLLGVSMIGVAVGCDSETSAEDYPERDITVIVPFPAGGSADAGNRLIEEAWDNQHDESLVIEYREGAGGEVGFSEISNAQPDGYTLGNVHTPHVPLQSIGRDPDFDIDSYNYVARLVSDPQVLAVREDSELETLNDFIEEAQANPGSLNVTTTGILTGDYLTTLQLMDEADIELNPSPVAGTADQIAALRGGHVDAMMGNVSEIVDDPEEYNVLAVATEERHEWLPDDPTFQEQDINLVASIDRGWAMPSEAPDEIADYVTEVLEEIYESEDYLDNMENVGLTPGFLAGDEWEEQIKEEEEEAREILHEYDEYFEDLDIED